MKRQRAQLEANANNLIVNSNNNASNGIWDVVIVGAGPAGATCAYHLAKSNLRVLLLDRDPFPRDKVCGDELTPVAQELLSDMGVLPQLVNDNAVRWVRILLAPFFHRAYLRWRLLCCVAFVVSLWAFGSRMAYLGSRNFSLWQEELSALVAAASLAKSRKRKEC
jgi:hypothetical protein